MHKKIYFKEVNDMWCIYGMFACMAFACSVDLYRWNKKRKGGDGK